MSVKNGYNINKLEGDGYLILPISMSRISTGQSPEKVYEILSSFDDILYTLNNDVILMYTNGLYFNTDEIASKKRIKTNNQILTHSQELRSIIRKQKEFSSKAIHFLPIDYIILNSENFQEMFNVLKKQIEVDENFKKYIEDDLKRLAKREMSEANINFTLEEIVISHILREQMVELPYKLAKNDDWRLVCYPGNYIKSEVYVYQQKFLERNKNCKNEYRGSLYNFDKKVLEVFDEINLEE
jgi:hypothetical protein